MSDNEKLTFWQTLKSTLMSFLGVQRNEIRKRDFEKGNPVHFIFVGLLVTVVFVLAVIIIVQLILSFAQD